ncbi:MAG: hypothetical protein QM756_33535 [Polyangiaceae bacterium]
MEAILQGIQGLEGVLGAAAIGPTGEVVAYKVSPVYDLGMLEQFSSAVATALDSLQLAQEDWDSVTANFADGKVLLRNLMVNGAPPPSGLRALAVLADARLNLSFAGVAIRVAVAKLKAASAMDVAVSSGASSSGMLKASSSQMLISTPVSVSSIGPSQSSASLSDLASTGLSWSGMSGSSSMAASGVSVTDPASAAFLTSCTKALARSVGPMAKAFVKDAIRKLWPGRAFSLDLAPALMVELERHIEDPADRSQFRKAVKTA